MAASIILGDLVLTNTYTAAVPVQAGVPEYFGGKKTVTLYTGRTVKNPAVNYFLRIRGLVFLKKQVKM